MWTETHEQALQALIAKAVAKYPYNEARILRGADLVRHGSVALHTNGTATVTSNYHEYRVNGHCPCVDAVQGNAPDGNCKHKWAKSLAKKMAFALIDPDLWTPNDYIASAFGFNGIARQVGEAQFHFHPYTPEGKVLRRHVELLPHEVALGMKVLDVVAAHGAIEWAEQPEEALV